MELGPTYLNFDQDLSTSESKSYHLIKSLLTQILDASTLPIVSDSTFPIDQNWVHLTMGDSATEVDYNLYPKHLISMFCVDLISAKHPCQK